MIASIVAVLLGLATSAARAEQTLTCPSGEPAQYGLRVGGIYSDPQGSVVDEDKEAAYRAGLAALNSFLDKVTALSDRAWSGDKFAASCAISLMRNWASADSLELGSFSHQGKTVRSWALATLSISYLKLKAQNNRDTSIEAWLVDLAEEVIKYRAEREIRYKGAWTNIDNWIALAIGGAAVAAGQPELWKHANAAYLRGLGEIRSDGHLDTELKRGQKSLQYHSFAGAPLAAMERLSSLQSTPASPRNIADLRRLALFVIDCIRDRSIINRMAGVNQTSVGSTAWLGLIKDNLPAGALAGVRVPASDRRLGGNIQAFLQAVSALKGRSGERY